MKKQFLILAAALVAAATAQAQSTSPFYGTVAVGSSHLNVDCTGVSSCDATDTGAKLIGGYSLGNGLSVEASYFSFGKFRAADGGIAMSAKPTALALGLAYEAPLNTDWALIGRLGMAQVRTKISASAGGASGSDSDSKAKLYAGLGVSYAVSPTVKLELALDTTKAEYAGESGNLRLISLGAKFAF